MSNKTPKPDDTSQTLMSRRTLLKATVATGAAAAVVGMPEKAEAATGRRPRGTACTGLGANEAFPLSPLVLRPFTEPMPEPKVNNGLGPNSNNRPVPLARQTWRAPGTRYSDVGQQDSFGASHQMYPGDTNPVTAGMPDPIVYKMEMRTGTHSYSRNPVRTLVQYRNTSGSLVPAGTVVPRMPDTTIYGFHGIYYGGALLNVEYGKPVLLRLENKIDENPRNLDRSDYGAPTLGFLTHLHNGHQAAESDGNPHQHPEGYLPGQWVENLYLNYAAGGHDEEKMSSLWFHDHYEGHTGANVYKGMAGLFPVYDPGFDSGRETEGLRLPGVRTDYADGSFDVDYDQYLVLHDVALDDGNTPHQDFHNGCGDVQPFNWGKGYFRHFPNHGFVGDVFCVNGKANPVWNVKRRKYRVRFLGASISRNWEVVWMKSPSQPVASVDLGFTALGDLQGQYRLANATQALTMSQIAVGGGLLPNVISRDSIEIWPAGRPQAVMDFTKYADGTPTQKGDVIWLCNIAKMPDGRALQSSTRLGNLDPAYVVPMLKVVIGDDAPDQSVDFPDGKPLRPIPPIDPAVLAAAPRRTVKLERGGGGGEIQWMINGLPFDPAVPAMTVNRGVGEVWTIETGGGWSHPMHFHQEEFRILTRNGQPTPASFFHRDDVSKDDVLDLSPSEKVEIYRNFRTFTGKYVAHCHNLAHEDHAMMFGWILAP